MREVTPDAVAHPSAVTRRLRWTIGSLTIVVAVSLAGGIAAAIAGGSFTDLGSGAGGLFGIPAILMTLIALLVATPVAAIVAHDARHSSGWLRAGIIIAAGAWILAIGYSVVAHTIDPCANGWWDTRSRIGNQPLCERFGPDLNWHTRFHLLAHAVPSAFLLAAYIWSIRRWTAVEPSAQQSRSLAKPSGLGGR